MSGTPHSPPRWASFAGVGVIGFGVQLAVLALLTEAAALPPALATALAVEITVLHNFAWHERWTWRDRAGGGRARVLARLARFHAGAGIVSLAGNVAITVAAVEWLHVPVVVANTGAVAVLGALNFLIADRYVFEPVPGHVASQRGTAYVVNGTLLPVPVAKRPVQDPAAEIRTLFRRR